MISHAQVNVNDIIILYRFHSHLLVELTIAKISEIYEFMPKKNKSAKAEKIQIILSNELNLKKDVEIKLEATTKYNEEIILNTKENESFVKIEEIDKLKTLVSNNIQKLINNIKNNINYLIEQKFIPKREWLPNQINIFDIICISNLKKEDGILYNICKKIDHKLENLVELNNSYFYIIKSFIHSINVGTKKTSINLKDGIEIQLEYNTIRLEKRNNSTVTITEEFRILSDLILITQEDCQQVIQKLEMELETAKNNVLNTIDKIKREFAK